MAKREIPLFIFDCDRQHSIGECDFVSCTDVDNAFVAKIDFVENAKDVVTDTMRIGRANNGISMRLEIKRITGKNPDIAQIRTLLRKAEELYVERVQETVDSSQPTDAEMISFLDALISGNKGQISGIKDPNEKMIALTSLEMLQHIRNRIKYLYN